MQHFTERKTFCFSKQQIKTMQKMKEKYHIDISDFMRDAFREKLQRERHELIHKELVNICPFSGQNY